MSSAVAENQRGQGLRSLTSLVFSSTTGRTIGVALALVCIGAASACERAPGLRRYREVVYVHPSALDSLDVGCSSLPDTLVEPSLAMFDDHDFPDARLVLHNGCRASIGFVAGAHIQRTYRVQVPAGKTLIIRARGEYAGVTTAFDYPATADSSGSNVGRLRIDSLVATQDREVAVRVMLVPKLREEPRTSRVLLSLVVR